MSGVTIPANQWVSTGNEFLKDAVAGTAGTQGINVSGSETCYAGSSSGLVTVENNDKVFTYVSTSNGGVRLRVYDKNTNSWGDQWSWVSQPGSGYSGSQSIAALAISEDGNYLAVGQGNPSSFVAIGMPSHGIQIGEIQPFPIRRSPCRWRQGLSRCIHSLQLQHGISDVRHALACSPACAPLRRAGPPALTQAQAPVLPRRQQRQPAPGGEQGWLASQQAPPIHQHRHGAGIWI